MPAGVAIRVTTSTPDTARALLIRNGISFITTPEGGMRIPAYYAGNTIIEIYPEA